MACGAHGWVLCSAALLLRKTNGLNRRCEPTRDWALRKPLPTDSSCPALCFNILHASPTSYGRPASTRVATGRLVARQRPIVATDLLRIQRITEVEAAPNGSFAVCGVQSIHTEPPKGEAGGDPTYSNQVHLWMVDLKSPSAQPAQLTFGERNVSDFEISPDGSQLAFGRVDRSQSKPNRRFGFCRSALPAKRRKLPTWSWAPSLPAGGRVARRCLPGKPPFSLERPERDWPEHTKRTRAAEN